MVRPSDQTAKKVTHKSMYHTLQSDKKKLIFFYHEVHRSLTMIREMKLVPYEIRIHLIGPDHVTRVQLAFSHNKLVHNLAHSLKKQITTKNSLHK